MKRNLSILFGASTLFLAGVLSYAQTQDTQAPHGGAVREAMKQRREAFKADLGLTDAQREEIGKAREGARANRKATMTGLKTSRKDLRALLEADTVDQKAVDGKIAEIQAAEGALVKQRVENVLAMKRILTPEQQKKISTMREQRHARRGKMRHHTGDGLHERMQKRHDTGGTTEGDRTL